MDRSLINSNLGDQRLQKNVNSSIGKFDVSDSGRPEVVIDRDLIDQARKVGRTGILTSMVLYDTNKKEVQDMNKKTLLEYRSIDEGKTSASSTSSKTPDKRPPATEIDQLLEDVNRPLDPSNPESQGNEDEGEFKKCKVGGKLIE